MILVQHLRNSTLHAAHQAFAWCHQRTQPTPSNTLRANGLGCCSVLVAPALMPFQGRGPRGHRRGHRSPRGGGAGVVVRRGHGAGGPAAEAPPQGADRRGCGGFSVGVDGRRGGSGGVVVVGPRRRHGPRQPPAAPRHARRARARREVRRARGADLAGGARRLRGSLCPEVIGSIFNVGANFFHSVARYMGPSHLAR